MTSVSTKPYLIRAIYEWCVDQGYTPYMAALVDENTLVPPGSARDGQIVLNIGPDASHQLMMGNERITFQARFGGVAQSLSIPVGNVIAVYARENGQGMAFELEGAVPAEGDEEDVQADGEDGSEAGAQDPAAGPAVAPDSAPTGGGRPGGGRGGHLKVIK